MSLTLHEHPFSSYCWKALIALYERDVPFTPALEEADRRSSLVTATRPCARAYGTA